LIWKHTFNKFDVHISIINQENSHPSFARVSQAFITFVQDSFYFHTNMTYQIPFSSVTGIRTSFSIRTIIFGHQSTTSHPQNAHKKKGILPISTQNKKTLLHRNDYLQRERDIKKQLSFQEHFILQKMECGAT